MSRRAMEMEKNKVHVIDYVQLNRFRFLEYNEKKKW